MINGKRPLVLFIIIAYMLIIPQLRSELLDKELCGQHFQKKLSSLNEGYYALNETFFNYYNRSKVIKYFPKDNSRWNSLLNSLLKGYKN